MLGFTITPISYRTDSSILGKERRDECGMRDDYYPAFGSCFGVEMNDPRTRKNGVEERCLINSRSQPICFYCRRAQFPIFEFGFLRGIFGKEEVIAFWKKDQYFEREDQYFENIYNQYY